MQFLQQAKKLLFFRDQISFFHHLSEQVYQKSRQYHIDALPLIPPEDQNIVNQLHKEGVVITSLENLALRLTPQILADSEQIIPHLLKILPDDKNQYIIKASSQFLLKYPSLFSWGLEKRLLNIIENYLELPVAYHGIYFRRDLANTVKGKTRLWHLDREDRKMIKVIIYLRDVGDKNGPFQYIPKSIMSLIPDKKKLSYGRISDQKMESIIPSSQWKSCLGKSGTVILVDTAQVVHRGKIPIASDRFSIFFDYTSRQPKHPYFCKSCCKIDELIQLSQSLENKAINYIFWNLNLQNKYNQKTQML